MRYRKFARLMDVLQVRIEQEGKKSPEWFLGFVEGLGTQSLSGNQIGALINLLLVNTHSESEVQIVEQIKQTCNQTSNSSLPVPPVFK